MEVADDIEKIDGTRIGNAYVVRVDDGMMIVDTSMPWGARRVLDAVTTLGYSVHDVRAIVLTHWHPDHMGSADVLRRATGAPIAIHEFDAPVLARRERPRKGRRAMGLEVLHGPGHTAGSIALRRSDGLLLSGDALLPDRRGRARSPDPGLSLDPVQASASAAAATALPDLAPSLLLPGAWCTGASAIPLRFTSRWSVVSQATFRSIDTIGPW